MAPPIALEAEDHSRDAAFNKAMHGKLEQKGFRSMISKDHAAHKAAADEYFKHWDDKSAETETLEVREVRLSSCQFPSKICRLDIIQARKQEYATLTRQ